MKLSTFQTIRKMKKNNLLIGLMALAMAATALTACTENDTPAPDGTDTDTPGGGTTNNDNALVQLSFTADPEHDAGQSAYVIAAQVRAGTSTENVILTASSLDQGTVTTSGNGLKNEGGTQWVFYKNLYLYNLKYNDGNAGTTQSYIIDASLNPLKRDYEYEVQRFTTYGYYHNYIVTASTGDGDPAWNDANGYTPQAFLLSYLDVNNETKVENPMSKAYLSENFLGNGEYVTLTGMEQVDDKLYSAAVPMGLSQYGCMQKDDAGNFPMVDKLIEVAEYFGFDGWFLNQSMGTDYGLTPEELEELKKQADQASEDAKKAVEECTTNLRIESSRGTVFKNDSISTVLSVAIYRGSQRITDSETLKSVIPGAYLQWKWLRLDDESYGIISADDERFGDNGFTFTLSPDDVDTKVTFLCELIV